MSPKIIINPVTRISGFMEIEAVVENNQIIDAKTAGLLFRGFENMLTGRKPFDAVYFTQRICGICSTAHSVASTLALEAAMQFTPSEQGRYLRDILHGCEFLQNHLRHFYLYTIPDFVRLPISSAIYEPDHDDYRLPQAENDLIAAHYLLGIEISRQAHEMLAVLGGKAPHNHGVFLGGITTQATADKIIKIKSLLAVIEEFIETKMIPDVNIIAEYYRDYFQIGRGHGNLLSYGCFYGYQDLGTLYVDPLVEVNGVVSRFTPAGITENIAYAWYKDQQQISKPMENLPEAEPNKAQAYSWVKAPRYYGLPMETGPLSRQYLSGEYTNGISTMDRTIARVLEARKIAQVIRVLLDKIIPNIDFQEAYQLPERADGVGLIDTTRGALGHWLSIREQVIAFYQIITPSGWNLSTRTSDNIKGTAEQALIGTTIADPEHPVEIGRIIRAFDPCVSCATHVYSKGQYIKTVQVM